MTIKMGTLAKWPIETNEFEKEQKLSKTKISEIGQIYTHKKNKKSASTRCHKFFLTPSIIFLTAAAGVKKFIKSVKKFIKCQKKFGQHNFLFH